VNTVPGIVPKSLAVALSSVYLQLAISPAPTSVAIACATPGLAVSTPAIHANSTAKDKAADWRTVVLITVTPPEWGGGRKAINPALALDSTIRIYR
jgi:hypothetical protein